MSLFLQALKCQRVPRPPVWLMRQAGRCLPEYRKLRAKHPLETLFRTPELAAQVTLMPLETLGVDAAILFSDILAIAPMFGLSLSFVEGRGPVIAPTIQTEDDVRRLTQREGIEAVEYLGETIPLVKQETSLPLIGLCGGPFSVATYLLADRHEEGVRRAKAWMASSPDIFHMLLEKLTEASIAFLKLQIAAGVDAVQVFDSWANYLEGDQLHAFSLSYLQKIVEAVDVPVILFARGSSAIPDRLSCLNPAGISFDWDVPIAELRRRVPSHIAVQGNLNPSTLLESPKVIEQKTQAMLTSMQNKPGYIVNLGHGVLPDTPIQHVQHFVSIVRTFLNFSGQSGG